MRKLSEKERLEFAAEMEAALQKNTALLLSASPELATVQAQIALLKNFKVPMFAPSSAQDTAQPTRQQGDAIAAGASSRQGKAASLVDFLQDATGCRLNAAQRDAALAIADSLEADPQTRNFAALLFAWEECPALYEFVNSVAGAFITEDMRRATSPLESPPRLH